MWSSSLANFVIVGLLSGYVSLSRDMKCIESILWSLTKDCNMFHCCEISLLWGLVVYLNFWYLFISEF